MTLPVLNRERAPERWDPFRELDDLYDRLAKVWDAAPLGALDRWVPSADLEETDDAYVVELELPGLARDDVDVRLDDRVLTVSGEIRERKRTGILHRRARKVGKFRYAVTLPAEVDDEHAEASLRDGVLTVRVAKPAQSRRRRIPIRR
ncbi:Hsp20/alpha crystallin family protein [Blastococcus sp. SYSU DS0533]